MRTTITLSDDVAAALEQHRHDHSIGLSDAVNDLVRAGLTARRPAGTFTQATYDLGRGIDVSNIGEVLETLGGPTSI